MSLLFSKRKILLFSLLNLLLFFTFPCYASVFDPHEEDDLLNDVLEDATVDIDGPYIPSEEEEESEEDVEELPEIPETPEEEKAALKFAYDPGYYISPHLGTAILSSPFAASIYGGCEYKDLFHIKPFFWGAGLSFELGFPRLDFPYEYRSNGSKMLPPDLFSVLLYSAGGIYYGPFSNENLAFNMSFRLGLKFTSLVSFEQNVSTVMHPAFYTAMVLGFDFYRWNAGLIFAYDSIGGFSPALDLSYRFKLKKLIKTKKEVMNEEVNEDLNEEF